MSRSKKSRKPGGAPTAKPKLSKQELAKVEKRIRKTTGKVAGNRQKEAAPEQTKKNQQGGNKDPRLGNKTPIALGKIASNTDKSTEAKAKQSEPKSSPIASVRFVENSNNEQGDLTPKVLSPEQELFAIEEDEALQNILAKQEEDIALTESEVNYYNEMMERHQQLSTELGLDDEDELIESEQPERSQSEDDLWDKLDTHNFSDFNDDAENKE